MSDIAAAPAAITTQELLDAGVHFGHLKKKWNPRMLPNIFMERRGIHIIDLNRTSEALIRAAEAIKNIARSGRKILFVATKKQGREVVAELARSVNMPYVADRWLGGMLTNFATIKKSIKKMQNIERMLTDPTVSITKKERLVLGREREKLGRVLGGIEHISRIPAALFVVDIGHEHIALAEAKRLNLVTFGMVDTNCDPNQVDFPIPANDDAAKSIQLITNYLVEAIKAGLADRQNDKDNEPEEDDSLEMENRRDRFADKDDDKDNRRRGANRGGGQGGANRGGGQGGANRGGQGGNRGGGPGGNRGGGPGGGGKR
jgi:small subunit ribosomal protein S2